MATITGNEYDHIDINDGTNVTRHALKDTVARADLQDLKSAIPNNNKYFIGEDNLAVRATWTLNQYWNDSGVITNSSNLMHSDLLPVETGTYTYVMQVGSTENYVRIHGFDANGSSPQLLYKSNIGSSGNPNMVIKPTFTVPSGVALIGISMAKPSVGTVPKILFAVFNGTETLTERVDNLDDVTGIFADEDDKTNGNILIDEGIGWISNQDGSFHSNYSYLFKRYIVTGVESVFIKYADIQGSSVSVVNFFDLSGTYLGHYLDGESALIEYKNRYISVPANARYLVIVYSNTCNYSVNYGSKYVYNLLYKSIRPSYFSAPVLESGNGWVNKTTGVLNTSSPYNYKYKKIAYDSTNQYVIKDVYNSSDSTAVINYYDSSDNYLGYDYDLIRSPYSITKYDTIYVNPPQNTAYFIAVCDTTNENKWSVIVSQNGNTKNSYWDGKSVLWLGTSIPATPYTNGQAYPQIVGDNIGAIITNNAISGSCARKRFDPNNLPEMQNLSVEWDLRSLVTSYSDIDDLATNWATYKSCFTNPPDQLSTERINFLKKNSYENRIDPYLAEGVDLIVFDHGRNDYPNMINSNDLFDKATFVGAMNTLIKHIYEVNPRQRICMISHYENQEFATVVEYQEYVANYWSIPLFRLDKMLGWSNREITTNHNWNGGVFEETESANNMVVHHAWLKDNLHPYMDDTGEATNLIANAITAWIKTVV